MEEFNLRLAKLEEIMNIWARSGRLSVIECCDDKEGLCMIFVCKCFHKTVL